MSGRRGKNDAADAAAICEAVTRPAMLFVPVKEEHQQIILRLHRTRQGFIEERTASYNRLRGLIAEFGIGSVHAAQLQTEISMRTKPANLHCARFQSGIDRVAGFQPEQQHAELTGMVIGVALCDHLQANLPV